MLGKEGVSFFARYPKKRAMFFWLVAVKEKNRLFPEKEKEKLVAVKERNRLFPEKEK